MNFEQDHIQSYLPTFHYKHNLCLFLLFSLTLAVKEVSFAQKEKFTFRGQTVRECGSKTQLARYTSLSFCC